MTLKIYPLFYDGDKLTLYTTISLSLELEPCEDQSVAPAIRDTRTQAIMERLIKGLVDNPEDVESYSIPAIVPFYSQTAQMEYPSPCRIITNEALKPVFDTLAIWKNEKGILPTRVVTTESIYSRGYSGDNQAQIRAYIKTVHQDSGVQWVLLAGDTSVIPVRRASPPLPDLTTDPYVDTPTDLYYSDLDGTWDDNENGSYGEPYQKSDLSSIQCISPIIGDSRGWIVGSGGLVARTLNSGNGWSDTSITSSDLNDVYFLNQIAGWIVDAGGRIFNTMNGGATWSLQYRTCDTSLSLNAVDFVTANNGWAVGMWTEQQGSIFKPRGTVFHYDGSQWIKQKDSLPGGLSDVDFVDSLYGWAVSSSRDIFGGDSTFKIFQTTDGGANWAVQYQINLRNEGLNACFFLDRNQGWVVGNGVILRTTNGGANWTDVRPDNCPDLYDVHFVDAKEGWAVGPTTGAVFGKILHTADSGKTWTEQWSQSSIDLHGVSFANKDTGWAVCDQSIVLFTEDGGTTWQKRNDILFYQGDSSTNEISPDIFIGRAPVQTQTEARTFVSKVINYEINPPINYAQKMLFLAGQQAVDDSSNITHMDSLRLQSWFPRNIYTHRLYGPAILGADAIDSSKTVNALNDGYHFVLHDDHSGYLNMGTGILVGGGNIYNGDVDKLKNKDRLSIIFSEGCEANRFIADSPDAISEHFLNDSARGAVAFIGNTGYGCWGGGNGYTITFDQYYPFFQSIFTSGDSSCDLGAAFSTTQDLSKFGYYQSYSLNLLGDPTMEVWQKSYPPKLHVRFWPQTLEAGKTTQFTVYVYRKYLETETLSVCSAPPSEIPVPNAFVCLDKTGDVHLTGFTGADAKITFSVKPSTDGKMWVTASKPGYIPDSKYATVISIPPPGCPFVNSWNGYDFIKENSILPASELDTGSVTDYYRVNSAPESINGKYYLNLGEFDYEHTYLDRARLWAVDHPNNVEVDVAANGAVTPHIYSIPPTSCVDSFGNNQLPKVIAKDSSSFDIGNGNYLLVTFPSPPPSWSGSAILMSTPRCTASTHPPKYTPCLSAPRQGGGGYVNLGQVYSRALGDGGIVNTRGYGPSFKVTCIGDGKIDYLALTRVLVSDSISVRQCTLDSAVHSSSGDVTSKLLGNDRDYAELIPGDEIQLTYSVAPFDSLPWASRNRRDFVFISDGYYQTIESGGGQQSKGPGKTPLIYALYCGLPNPFKTQTRLRYSLPVETKVSLKIYDAMGRIVVTLVNGVVKPGFYNLDWNGRDNRGMKIGNGVYFIRMEADKFSKTEKVVLIK